MREEAPGRGVPLRRKEIAPILANEPGAEQSSDFGAACQIPELGNSADKEHCEHAEPQCELMDTEAAQVHARTEPVTFQAQHRAKLAPAGLAFDEAPPGWRLQALLVENVVVNARVPLAYRFPLVAGVVGEGLDEVQLSVELT